MKQKKSQVLSLPAQRSIQNTSMNQKIPEIPLFVPSPSKKSREIGIIPAAATLGVSLLVSTRLTCFIIHLPINGTHALSYFFPRFLKWFKPSANRIQDDLGVLLQLTELFLLTLLD